MKELTIKDYIYYNSPCFACNNKLKLKVWHQKLFPINSPYLITSSDIIGSFIFLYFHYKPNEKITMKINVKNNSFTSTCNFKLTDFLRNNSVYFEMQCYYCGFLSETNNLTFNFNNKTIKTLKVHNESMNLIINNKLVSLLLFYNNNKCLIDNQTSIPLIDRYKFQNKDLYLDKIKSLLNFI